MRFLLVGGGQGGSASQTMCSDAILQGGKGGDGGEVIEVDVTLAPGQCPSGFAIQVGRGGRGSFRAGHGGINGETGAPTVVSCGSTVIASALGGGSRASAGTTSKSTKGGDGGVILNALQSATNASFDQRSIDVRQATDGMTGLYGYGSGGGGGGAAQTITGFRVSGDGSTDRVPQLFNAPSGKGGHGAGNGGGPAGYHASAVSVPTESAAQYGAGGGGGSAQCSGAVGVGTDGGNGFQGVVRVTWQE